MTTKVARIAIIATWPFHPSYAQDDSVPIWIFNVVNRLIAHNDVVVYSPREGDQKEVEYCNGVKYRRIYAPIDKWLSYLIYGISKNPGLSVCLSKKTLL